ncbi:MAG: DUF3617 domain-containing protein [Sphingomonadales bacterium]|nr:DUF3617 domain-containing protein [Sphingomonadales bacterium]
MRAILVAGVAAAVLASTPALADLKLKTGLWKTSVKIEAAGGGMSFPATQAKFCVRETDNERWQDAIEDMQSEAQGDCSFDNREFGEDSFSFDMTCGAGFKGHMTGKVSETKLVQSGQMNMDQAGFKIAMNYESTSEWVASACPPGTPGAK